MAYPPLGQKEICPILMKYVILIAHKPFKCFKNTFNFSILKAKSNIRLRILALKISQVKKLFDNFHLPFG